MRNRCLEHELSIGLLGRLILISSVLLLPVAARGQTCNSNLDILPNPIGSELNRIVSETVDFDLVISNGPSGGSAQTFQEVLFFPACLSTSPCVDDPGATTQPVVFTSLNTQDCDATAPTVDTSDPTRIVIDYSGDGGFTLADPGSCTISITVTVADQGSDGTPLSIANEATVAGVCANTGTSSGSGSSGVTLLDCSVDVDKIICVDQDGDDVPDVCFDEAGTALDDVIATNLNGNAVTWQVVVENTGGSALAQCVLNDPTLGIVDLPIDDLASGAVTGTIELHTEDCSADVEGENTVTVSCGVCGDREITPASDSDTAELQCLGCSVQIDKQIDCFSDDSPADANGFVTSNEDGTGSCTGLTGEDIQLSYQALNTGEVDLNCAGGIADPEASFTSDPFGPLGPDDTSDIFTTTGLCEEVGSPNNGSVSCVCLASVNGEAIEGLTGFGDTSVEANDMAAHVCQTTGVTVVKECEDDGSGDFTLTITNTGTAALENCVVTDTWAAGECPVTDGTAGPSFDPFALAAGESVDLSDTIGPLDAPACNNVEVVCDVVGSDQTVMDDDDEFCEVPGEGCLTHTPGYWGTHPEVTDLFLPVESCGLTIDDVDAIPDGSAIQDVCFGGQDFKMGTKTKSDDTSPQQLQLIRQCTAAAINLSATAFFEGNCGEGILIDFAECCGGDTGGICNSGATAQEIDESGCIEVLDTFNNSEDVPFAGGPVELCPNETLGTEAPCDADSSVCQESSNDGKVNAGRSLGPGN